MSKGKWRSDRSLNTMGRMYRNTQERSELARRSYKEQGKLKVTLPTGEVRYFKNEFEYRRWKAVN